MSLATYFTRVKALWDELDDLCPLTICKCNPTTNFFKIQQDQRLMQFLMKLDPQYSQIRTNLLMLPDLPSIQDVYRMLLQEECHRELSTDHQTTKPMAFGVDRRKLPSNATHFKHQHQDKHHTNTPSRKPSCFYDHCKIVGHSIDRCFKIHGYLNKSKNSSSKKYAAVAHADDSNSPSPNGNSFGLSQEQFTNLLSYLG